MSRTLSAGLLSQINSNNQTDPLIPLLKIEQTDITTLYLCRNGENVTSNGQLYTAYPFDIAMPKDGEGPPEVTLIIDNTDQSIVTNARTMTSAATVTLSFVLNSQPDTVDIGPFAFKLRNVKYTRQAVEGVLTYNSILTSRFPTERITPNNFPAAVKQ